MMEEVKNTILREIWGVDSIVDVSIAVFPFLVIVLFVVVMGWVE
jgi:hypothetical protein